MHESIYNNQDHDQKMIALDTSNILFIMKYKHYQYIFWLHIHLLLEVYIFPNLYKQIEFNKALPIFNELIPIYKGTNKAKGLGILIDAWVIKCQIQYYQTVTAIYISK